MRASLDEPLCLGVLDLVLEGCVGLFFGSGDVFELLFLVLGRSFELQSKRWRMRLVRWVLCIS